MRALFNGVAGLASVRIGVRITVDDAVDGRDNPDRILPGAGLPGALCGGVPTGPGALATTPAVQDRSFDGRISFINSRADAATPSNRVRATIDYDADLLRPGVSFALMPDLPCRSFPAASEPPLHFCERGIACLACGGYPETLRLRVSFSTTCQSIRSGPASENGGRLRPKSFNAPRVSPDAAGFYAKCRKIEQGGCVPVRTIPLAVFRCPFELPQTGHRSRVRI